MISSELLAIYESVSAGSTYTDPTGKLTTNVHMTAYVDDVNSHHSLPYTTTFPKTTEVLLKQAATWEKLLHISGGKLSSTKCTYYISKWKHSSTGHPILQSEDLPFITLRTNTDSIQIEGISSVHRHKTLGYYQSIGKSSVHQNILLQDKMENNMKQIHSTKLKFNEFARFYRSILTPRITYTTGLSNISKCQADQLTS
jgi:hypothetical protein